MEYSVDLDHMSHAVTILENLDEMGKNKQMCDFMIKVESEEFPAHKNVLSAGSDYFKAMLSHDTSEAQTGFVEMKHICPVSVKKCIDYIYSGKLLVTKENIEQVLNTANMMQLQKICDGIFDFLAKELTPFSFHSTKDIAEFFNSAKLIENCKEYAQANFLSIVRLDDFKFFEYKYLSFLIESKNTKASEAAKCKALMIWTKFDIEARKSTFCEAFCKLNLGKMPLQYRMYMLEKDSLLLNSASCMDKLLQSRMFKQCNVEAKDINFESDVDESDNVIAIFDTPSKSIQCFHPQQKSWTKLCDVSDEFNDHVFSTALVNDIIYVFEINSCNYTLDYTAPNPSWDQLPCRSLTDNRVTPAVVDNIIYLFEDSGEGSSIVEKFDILSRIWSYATDRPQPVAHSLTAIIAVKNYIYVIGGHITINSAKFDPVLSEWTTIPRMPTKRYGAAPAEFDGKIYVIGGWTYEEGELNVVECLDTVTEMWTRVPDLNIVRGSFRACVIKGKIYAVGGESSDDTIEEMDPTENTWRVIERMTDKDYECWGSLALNVCF